MSFIATSKMLLMTVLILTVQKREIFEQKVCDSQAALQKSTELQRLPEKHVSELGQEFLEAMDWAVNSIHRTPFTSALKQTTIDSMFHINT
jgi:hypothetical protein